MSSNTLIRSLVNSARTRSVVSAGANRQLLATPSRPFSQSVGARLSASSPRENEGTPKDLEKHRVRVTEPENATTQPIVHEYKEPKHEPMSYVSGSRKTMGTFSMEKKSVIITGGASGIGKVLASAFVESGATQVAILDLNEKAAKEVAQEMKEYWGQNGVDASSLDIRGIACDVSKEDSVQAAFDAAIKAFGKLDVMVNSAGIVENFPATEYPTPKLQKLVDINIMGSYFTAREAAKRMDKGSSIILIGSMSGMVINVPQPQSPYNMSKAAVIHLAKSLAVEWAPRGIRVNCISPGYVLTALTKTILDANTELRDTWVNMTPAGRLADPQDLKGAIIYLASDASQFTTGSNMVIDGGYTCT